MLPIVSRQEGNERLIIYCFLIDNRLSEADIANQSIIAQFKGRADRRRPFVELAWRYDVEFFGDAFLILTA